MTDPTTPLAAREALEFIERVATMGFCSQTHHEHLVRDANRFLAAQPARSAGEGVAREDELLDALDGLLDYPYIMDGYGCRGCQQETGHSDSCPVGKALAVWSSATLGSSALAAQPARSAGEGVEALNGAYRERNRLVAALLRVGGFPAEVVMASDTEGWFIVYAETPAGQVSWHIGPDDMDLFRDWPVAFGTLPSPWDGHDTDEKYRRVAALAAPPELTHPERPASVPPPAPDREARLVEALEAIVARCQGEWRWYRVSDDLIQNARAALASARDTGARGEGS